MRKSAGMGAATGAADPDLNPTATLHPSSTSGAGSAKMKILIPSIDVALLKSMLPMPSVALHFQRLTVLQLPVSDETLCHYLAFLLAQMLPFFSY